MKFIKFLFTLFWLLIVLGFTNVFVVMVIGHAMPPKVVVPANLISYCVMFVVWYLFPYTVAPMLRITESPFKLFSMRCTAAMVGAFFILGMPSI